MFGYTNTPRDGMTQTIINAYLQVNQKWNVLVLDDSSITVDQAYNVAVSLQNSLASKVAEQVDGLIDQGVELCHLAGHSLGAQLAAAIGRSMKNVVKHMILLDPAGPLFYPPANCTKSVSTMDAECLETIHTDSGMLGAPLEFPGGTINYYPNEGIRSQPNCSDTRIPNAQSQNIETGCSHCRAVYFYADSLQDPSRYVGLECPSWDDFQAGKCEGNVQNTFGTCSNTSVPGKYYLRTTGREPYGLGMEGIEPASDQSTTKRSI